jgi:ceramide glucosyltransferase
VSPLGYAGWIITHPLPLALLGAALMGFPMFSVIIIGVSIACRLVLQLQVDHTLRVSWSRWWLGPVRDLLAFAIHVASFFIGAVSWRGHRYEVRADGTLIPIEGPRK